jgi:hypothetical protein
MTRKKQQSSNNKKSFLEETIELTMMYGWALLLVLAAVGIVLFIVSSGNINRLKGGVQTYDCGEYYLRGTEHTTGELKDAAIRMKDGSDEEYVGSYLKLYYDRSRCVRME